ncbi:hypothetical protein [Streptomyces sp. NPDC046862]|uniref:hypothetical protein n=1 Tax=Streptomyces sp. NPDC046862 TaxID=3154603 RepID=UPI003452D6DC
MSAPSRAQAFRKTARQFTLALVLCAGVAGGAAIGAAPGQEGPTHRVTADNDWPTPPSPAPAASSF